MKKLKLLLALSLLACNCWAQHISVISVERNVTDLTASGSRRYDIYGEPGALVKVQFPENDAQFESGTLVNNILGNVENKTGEYWVYLAKETKQLTIKHPKFHPLTINFPDYNIKGVESLATYVVRLQAEQQGWESKFKYKCVYLEPKIQIGGLTSFGLSVGGYYQHLNIELSYLMGLAESEEIYWNNTSASGDNLASSYTYKPSCFGGKFGYAFYVGKPFRITPQLGLGLISLKGTEKQQGSGSIDAANGYALSASVSGRIDYLILPWLGVGLSPEYSIALSKSDLFERVADVSSKVKGFASGFNVKIGVYVTF